MTTEELADIAHSELKAAREAAGLTLKDMFEQTRVSVVNLLAIENGNFETLPAPIYTRNFIHTYAGALGVDAGPTLRRYEDFLYAKKMQATEVEAQQKEEKKLFRNRAERHKISLWIAAIVIVFAAAAIFVTLQYSTPDSVIQQNTAEQKAETKETTTDEIPANGSEAQVLPEETVATTSPALNGPAAVQTAAATGPEEWLDPSDLIITATEETWVRIVADEQPPFEALLKPGERLSRKAGRFDLDIGNAGGIKLVFQGKLIENLGKSGQVIHLRLP